jgi:CRISPR type III-A-associated RAMP protein Csm5
MAELSAWMWETSPDPPDQYSIQILSPVHIGCDEEILPVEYFVQGQELVLCDVESMFKDPEFDVDAFVRFIKDEKVPYLGDFLDRGPKEEYIKTRLKLEVMGGLKVPYPSIKKHVRTGGVPYIPGSSIKGAMWSALLYYGLKKQSVVPELKEVIRACLCKEQKTIAISMKRPNLTKYIHKPKGFLEILHRIGLDYYLKEGINLFKRDLDFASLIEVSDTYPKKDVRTAVYGSKVAGTSRQMPAYFEVLEPQQEFYFHVKGLGFKFKLKTLAQIINNYYITVCKRDMEWYRERGVSSAEGFLKRLIATIKEQKTESEAYLIRLGQGSGAVATSLLILAEELEVVDEYIQNWPVTGHRTLEPKTRKLLLDVQGNTIPMGWAVLKPYEG